MLHMSYPGEQRDAHRSDNRSCHLSGLPHWVSVLCAQFFKVWYFLTALPSLLTSRTVAPVAQCQLLLDFIAFFFVVAMPATSLLFFFRVRAVWSNSKMISYFFGLMWLATFGLCVPIPWAVKGGRSYFIGGIAFLAYSFIYRTHRPDPTLYQHRCTLVHFDTNCC